MHPKAALLSVVIACAVACPGALAAQQGWKTLIIIDKPVFPVLPTLQVDTQRVVREGDGIYTAYLRWSSSADSPLAPRTDRIERHRLDCRARQTSLIAASVVPVRGGKDSTMVGMAGADSTTHYFAGYGGAERAGFEEVCRWAQAARPR